MLLLGSWMGAKGASAAGGAGVCMQHAYLYVHLGDGVAFSG